MAAGDRDRESPSSNGAEARLADVAREVVACRRCPRLVAWREAVAADPPRRFAGDRYHAKPVPGFGDPSARLLVAGLAPAAHGANRTGRMFTGDRSGEWLWRALHRAGFADRPESVSAGDGLTLRGAFVTAAARCAPPDNKPTREEFAACAPFLDAELAALRPNLRVVVALGSLAFEATLAAFERAGSAIPRPRPKFAHGRETRIEGAPPILASYHPSQQNTFTGRLTEEMFDAVWGRAAELAV